MAIIVRSYLAGTSKYNLLFSSTATLKIKIRVSPENRIYVIQCNTQVEFDKVWDYSESEWDEFFRTYEATHASQ